MLDVRERVKKTLIQVMVIAVPAFFQALDGKSITVKALWAAAVVAGSAAASFVQNTYINRRNGGSE